MRTFKIRYEIEDTGEWTASSGTIQARGARYSEARSNLLDALAQEHGDRSTLLLIDETITRTPRTPGHARALSRPGASLPRRGSWPTKTAA